MQNSWSNAASLLCLFHYTAPFVRPLLTAVTFPSSGYSRRAQQVTVAHVACRGYSGVLDRAKRGSYAAARVRSTLKVFIHTKEKIISIYRIGDAAMGVRMSLHIR